MAKDEQKQEKIEESIFEILKAILMKKNYREVFTINKVFFLIAIIAAFLMSFWYAKFHLAIYIYDLLQSFINVYSIIIGFSFAAITLIATMFNPKSIKIINLAPSKLYPEFSLYKATILVYFEYIIAFITTLIYMISCLFIFPFLKFFTCYRYQISNFFFVTFFILLMWSFLSIKALICNLYAVIMLKSKLEKDK